MPKRGNFLQIDQQPQKISSFSLFAEENDVASGE